MNISKILNKLDEAELTELKYEIDLALARQHKTRLGDNELMKTTLSTLACNVLEKHGVTTCKVLKAVDLEKIRKWDGMGKSTIEDIREFISITS